MSASVCDQSASASVRRPATATSHQLLLQMMAVSVALLALGATAVAAAIIPTADPYTIHTQTGAELVDVDDPLFNFTRHGWRGERAAQRSEAKRDHSQ